MFTGVSNELPADGAAAASSPPAPGLTPPAIPQAPAVSSELPNNCNAGAPVSAELAPQPPSPRHASPLQLPPLRRLPELAELQLSEPGNSPPALLAHRADVPLSPAVSDEDFWDAASSRTSADGADRCADSIQCANEPLCAPSAEFDGAALPTAGDALASHSSGPQQSSQASLGGLQSGPQRPQVSLAGQPRGGPGFAPDAQTVMGSSGDPASAAQSEEDARACGGPESPSFAPNPGTITGSSDDPAFAPSPAASTGPSSGPAFSPTPAATAGSSGGPTFAPTPESNASSYGDPGFAASSEPIDAGAWLAGPASSAAGPQPNVGGSGGPTSVPNPQANPWVSGGSASIPATIAGASSGPNSSRESEENPDAFGGPSSPTGTQANAGLPGSPTSVPSPESIAVDVESRYQQGSEYMNFGTDLGLCLTLGSQIGYPPDSEPLSVPEHISRLFPEHQRPLQFDPQDPGLADPSLARGLRSSDPASLSDLGILEPDDQPRATHASLGPAVLFDHLRASREPRGPAAAAAVPTTDFDAAVEFLGAPSPARTTQARDVTPDSFFPAADRLPRLDSPFASPGPMSSEPLLRALRLDDPQAEPLRRVDAEPAHPAPRFDTSVNVLSLFSQSILSSGPSSQSRMAQSSTSAPHNSASRTSSLSSRLSAVDVSRPESASHPPRGPQSTGPPSLVPQPSLVIFVPADRLVAIPGPRTEAYVNELRRQQAEVHPHPVPQPLFQPSFRFTGPNGAPNSAPNSAPARSGGPSGPRPQLRQLQLQSQSQSQTPRVRPSTTLVIKMRLPQPVAAQGPAPVDNLRLAVAQPGTTLLITSEPNTTLYVVARPNSVLLVTTQPSATNSDPHCSGVVHPGNSLVIVTLPGTTVLVTPQLAPREPSEVPVDHIRPDSDPTLQPQFAAPQSCAACAAGCALESWSVPQAPMQMDQLVEQLISNLWRKLIIKGIFSRARLQNRRHRPKRLQNTLSCYQQFRERYREALTVAMAASISPSTPITATPPRNNNPAGLLETAELGPGSPEHEESLLRASAPIPESSEHGVTPLIALSAVIEPNGYEASPLRASSQIPGSHEHGGLATEASARAPGPHVRRRLPRRASVPRQGGTFYGASSRRRPQNIFRPPRRRSLRETLREASLLEASRSQALNVPDPALLEQSQAQQARRRALNEQRRAPDGEIRGINGHSQALNRRSQGFNEHSPLLNQFSRELSEFSRELNDYNRELEAYNQELEAYSRALDGHGTGLGQPTQAQTEAPHSELIEVDRHLAIDEHGNRVCRFTLPGTHTVLGEMDVDDDLAAALEALDNRRRPAVEDDDDDDEDSFVRRRRKRVCRPRARYSYSHPLKYVHTYWENGRLTFEYLDRRRFRRRI